MSTGAGAGPGARIRRSFVSAEGIAFPLGSIPVLVRWSHFLLVGLIAWPLLSALMTQPRLWRVVIPALMAIPLAVLLHELGHAVAAMYFRGKPRVELVLFGGLTYPTLPPSVGPGARAIVSLAGPVAGLVTGGIVWLIVGGQPAVPTRLAPAADVFVWAAAVWGVLNLVPLPGLDGAHVLDGIAERLFGARGIKAVAGVKAVTLVAVLIAVWYFWGLFSALWIVLILGRSGVAEIQRGWEEPQRQLLGDAVAAYRAGRPEEASRLVEMAGGGLRDPRLRAAAQDLRWRLAVEQGDWERVVALGEEGDETDRSRVLTLAHAYLRLGRFSAAEALARSIDSPAARGIEAEALVRQDLAHHIEITGPEQAEAIVARAMVLVHQGEGDAAESLARLVSGSPVARPGTRARALLLLGEGDGFEQALDAVSPSERWALRLEQAGRSGADLAPVLEAGTDERIDPEGAVTAQVRLHQAGRWEAAAQVGRWLQGRLSSDRAKVVAYNLACSQARLGSPRTALATLREAFGDDLPEATLSDPDLAGVRSLPGFSTGPSPAGVYPDPP